MFQFPGFASKPLWIQDLDTSTDPPSGNHTVSHAVTRQEVEGGFPHSEILGSKPVRGSPRLIAAYHVLHRLSAPRHPPNALMTLDRSHDRCSLRHTTRVCRSRKAPSERPYRRPRARTRRRLASMPGNPTRSHVRPVPRSCFPLHDVNHPQNPLPQGELSGPTKLFVPDIPMHAARHLSKRWWSQTGSNRRPHACKARALPTELWPQSWACGPSLCPC